MEIRRFLMFSGCSEHDMFVYLMWSLGTHHSHLKLGYVNIPRNGIVGEIGCTPV